MSIIRLDPLDLRPLVVEVAREILALNSSAILPPERLAFPEAEAAVVLGLSILLVRQSGQTSRHTWLSILVGQRETLSGLPLPT